MLTEEEKKTLDSLLKKVADHYFAKIEPAADQPAHELHKIIAYSNDIEKACGTIREAIGLPNSYM